MTSGFSKRTTAEGRINFGMWRVKYTRVIMHWAQDEIYCYHTASLTIIVNDEEYNALLFTVLYLSVIRKVEDYQFDTISNVEDLGKFKDERM